MFWSRILCLHFAITGGVLVKFFGAVLDGLNVS
jgi:hypothetical protein